MLIPAWMIGNSMPTRSHRGERMEDLHDEELPPTYGIAAERSPRRLSRQLEGAGPVVPRLSGRR